MRNNGQLYGHHHRPMDEIVKGKKWNVCVDANNFYPVSFTQLQSIMDSRESNWDVITPDMDEKRAKLKSQKKTE